MTPYQQIIAGLLIAMLVAFTSGYVIGRGEHVPSQIPSNLDVAAALGSAKASEDGLRACYQLLAGGIAEVKVACGKREETAH